MKIHIAKVEYGTLMLCDKVQDHDCAWPDKVKQYNDTVKPDWCEICKKIYNSEQLSPELQLI